MSSVSLRRSMVATVPCVADADTTGCADEPDPDAGFFDVPNKRENILDNGSIRAATVTHRDTADAQMQQRNERTLVIQCWSAAGRAGQPVHRKPPRTKGHATKDKGRRRGQRKGDGAGKAVQARAGEGEEGERGRKFALVSFKKGIPNQTPFTGSLSSSQITVEAACSAESWSPTHLSWFGLAELFGKYLLGEKKFP